MSTRPTLLRYKVRAVLDMDTHVQIKIAEDIETEKIDPIDRIIDSINKNPEIPEEVKKILIPYMKSYLKSIQQYIPTSPQIAVSQIMINLPRRLYDQMNRPNIGDTILMELRKESTD